MKDAIISFLIIFLIGAGVSVLVNTIKYNYEKGKVTYRDMGTNEYEFLLVDKKVEEIAFKYGTGYQFNFYLVNKAFPDKILVVSVSYSNWNKYNISNIIIAGLTNYGTKLYLK